MGRINIRCSWKFTQKSVVLCTIFNVLIKFPAPNTHTDGGPWSGKHAIQITNCAAPRHVPRRIDRPKARSSSGYVRQRESNLTWGFLTHVQPRIPLVR